VPAVERTAAAYPRAENIFGGEGVLFYYLFNIVEQLLRHGAPAAPDPCLKAELVYNNIVGVSLRSAEQNGALCSADVYTHYIFFHIISNHFRFYCTHIIHINLFSVNRIKMQIQEKLLYIAFTEVEKWF